MNETKPALRSKCRKILRGISIVKSIELYWTGRIPICQQQGPESEYGHFPDPSPWTPTATIYCPQALFKYHTALIFLQHLFQPSRSSSYFCLHFNSAELWICETGWMWKRKWLFIQFNPKIIYYTCQQSWRRFRFLLLVVPVAVFMLPTQ